MPRGSRPAKVRVWTDRLNRFELSGQTIAEFCKQESISTASFYQWRRKLAGRTSGQSAGTHEDTVPAGSIGGSQQVRPRAKRTARSDRPGPSFKQILLTGGQQSAGVLTVRLPDGMQLDIRSGLPGLESLVTKVLEHAAAGRQEGSC